MTRNLDSLIDGFVGNYNIRDRCILKVESQETVSFTDIDGSIKVYKLGDVAAIEVTHVVAHRAGENNARSE